MTYYHLVLLILILLVLQLQGDYIVSLCVYTFCYFRPEADVTGAKRAMLQHQLRVITSLDDGDCYQRIHVRRSHLVVDTLKAFGKPTFDESKILKVVFVGEPSVDEGGPRREFFQLALKEIFAHSGLFSGWPFNVLPLHNVEAVASNRFYVIGKFIATCLVQGGQPPACFATPAAEYLTYGEVKCDPSLADIPDALVQEKLLKVNIWCVVMVHLWLGIIMHA